MTKDCSSLQRKALFGIANWVLLAAGLVNLVVGTIAALDSTAAIAATSLTAGLVLIFAATIDRFESVKGLGVEAKTRQLDQKLYQADEALKRLRETTEMTCAALIDLNSKTGRIGTAPRPRESFALADRTRQIMSSLGCDQPTIVATLRPWARITCFDMARAQLAEVEQLLMERIRQLEAERQRIPQPIAPDNPEFQRLTAQINEVSTFLSSRLRKLHLIELPDFPDRFMALFSEAPLPDRTQIEPFRQRAARFAEGMRTLRDSSKLANAEEWIAELDRTREE